MRGAARGSGRRRCPPSHPKGLPHMAPLPAGGAFALPESAMLCSRLMDPPPHVAAVDGAVGQVPLPGATPAPSPLPPPPLDICRQSPRTNTGACAPTARANLGSQGHHVARRWHYGSGPLAPGLPRALADIILGQPRGIPGREPCGLQVPPHHERNSRNQERDRERVQGFHLPHPLLLSQPPPSPPSWG